MRPFTPPTQAQFDALLREMARRVEIVAQAAGTAVTRPAESWADVAASVAREFATI